MTFSDVCVVIEMYWWGLGVCLYFLTPPSPSSSCHLKKPVKNSSGVTSRELQQHGASRERDRADTAQVKARARKSAGGKKQRRRRRRRKGRCGEASEKTPRLVCGFIRAARSSRCLPPPSLLPLLSAAGIDLSATDSRSDFL